MMKEYDTGLFQGCIHCEHGLGRWKTDEMRGYICSDCKAAHEIKDVSRKELLIIQTALYHHAIDMIYEYETNEEIRDIIGFTSDDVDSAVKLALRMDPHRTKERLYEMAESRIMVGRI
ncbi:hypothetical protein J2Z48_002171 [Croceifilum oryzae]|uniref:Uncharacterized protein n=1 Tax=Croceifilum oryzae TaxID=1553429 RepID=A0AAJ1WQX6_9BACL|nr:hypothetical protein [Croceifilum oryzae]MDQ0417987.1 hypothetical protein [Croceifilum oryzae]